MSRGYKIPVKIRLPFRVPDFDEKEDCDHKWKKFFGEVVSFKYCVKCKDRRNLDDSRIG